MECVIGIDGGGTKSLLRMVDTERKVVYEIVGGGTNLCAMDSKAVKKNLEDIVESAVAHVPDAQLLSICIGAAGVIDEENRSFLKNVLKAYAPHIQVFDDAHIAMYANLKNDCGIVLTAGTGSIVYGRNRQGQVLRVGGWGHLMGDEGSGYQIGIQALNVIARNHDMQKDSRLFRALLEYFHCEDFQSLVGCVYNQAQDKKQIAALAYVVDESAKQGDEDALHILRQSAGQLVEMCDILIGQLCLEREPFLIVTNGSIIQKCHIVAEEFRALIGKKYPQARIKDVLVDPAWGAVEIALEHAG